MPTWTGTIRGLRGTAISTEKQKYYRAWKRGIRKATSIEGQKELAEKLRSLTGVPYSQNVVDAINRWAVMARDQTKRNIASVTEPKTGSLERSPFADTRHPFHDKWQPSALAGINPNIAPHWHFIEFGTVNMPARPFFRPAVESVAGAGQSAVRHALQSSIAKAVRSRVRPLTKPPVKING